MTDYIKETHTAIFTGPIDCGKGHLVLDLIEKEHNKLFGYIIIIYPMLHWCKKYCHKGWMRHDENVLLIEPKGKLYQWVGKFSGLGNLFIINCTVIDENFDKQRQGRHRNHYLW